MPSHGLTLSEWLWTVYSLSFGPCNSSFIYMLQLQLYAMNWTLWWVEDYGNMCLWTYVLSVICNMLHFFLNFEGLIIFLVQLSDGRETAAAIKQLIQYLAKTSYSLLQSKGRIVENGLFLGWEEEQWDNGFQRKKIALLKYVCTVYVLCVPVLFIS